MRNRLRMMVAATACVAMGASLFASLSAAAPTAAKRIPAKLGLQALRGDAPGGIASDCSLYGSVTNLTPYTWTLVGQHASDQSRDGALKSGLPPTFQPGQDISYQLSPYAGGPGVSTDCRYDMIFTYRAQTVTGPETLYVTISGCHCRYLLNPTSNSEVNVRVAGYNSAGQYGTIGWTQGDPIASDVQFQIQGHFNIDAAKDPPALIDLINGLCAGATGTSCSFTATGPLTWGVGKPVQEGEAANCTVPAAGRTRPAVGLAGSDPPPALDPNWYEFSVKASRTGSLTIGGSLTASSEVKLFDTVGIEVAAKFGAEHEWSDRKEFEKTTRVYIPSNYIAQVWLAPVVGKVIGTLVVSNALASYTITNFGQEQSGASRDLQTPAFNIMTTSRPMTATEYQNECIKKLGHRRTAARFASAQQGAGSL